MTGPRTWSEEEDDFLRRLVKSGSSASEARQQFEDVFGGGRTRNAVIGRASRLGLSFGGAQSNSAAAQIAGRSRGLASIAKIRKAAKVEPPAIERATVSPVPSPAKAVAPPLKPPAKQKHNANNIRIKATRHLDAAFEAQLAQSGGINPGVLFMERDMTKHCSAPMAGWDSAPITEKRVCGAPVEWRAVKVGGAGDSMEPTSWCTSCRKRFTVAATERRSDLRGLATLDRSVRRVA